LKDPGVPGLLDVPQNGGDDGGAVLWRGGFGERRHGLEIVEAVETWCDGPPCHTPHHGGKGATQQEAVLGLGLPTVGAGRRLNDVPVVEQSSRRKTILVNQPQEVLAAWQRSIVPNVGGEGVIRQQRHAPLVERGRGEEIVDKGCTMPSIESASRPLSVFW
jgi:hypothetical protein